MATVLLPIVACPPIQTATNWVSIADAVSSVTAPVAESMTVGTGQFFKFDTIRPHAARLDNLARYGATNAYAIAYGSNGGNELAVSLVSGRNILVKKGHALIGGIVEVNADTTYGVPNSGAGTYWIWLQQSGAVTSVYNSLMPPPGGEPSCLLASVVDTAGVLGAPDASGVLYLKGGQLYRASADAGGPTDVGAPGVQFTHRTAFASYHHDGVAYRQIGIPPVTADPAAPQDGDQWFRTDTGEHKLRAGGVSVIFSVAGAAVASVNGHTGVVVLAQSDIAGLVAALAAKEVTANKGAASGYAGLDGSGKVPTAQLPTPPVISVNGLTGAVTIPAGTLFTIGSGAPGFSGTSGDVYFDETAKVFYVNGGGSFWINTTPSTFVTSVTSPLSLSSGVLSLTTGAPVTRVTPSGSVNGSNVTFTLPDTPISGSEEVYLNGLLQEPGGADYSISAATITYATAPLSGDRLRVTYRK